MPPPTEQSPASGLVEAAPSQLRDTGLTAPVLGFRPKSTDISQPAPINAALALAIAFE